MSYAQSTNLPIPDLKVIPDKYQSGIQELFSRWQAVRQRNHILSEYYNLHQAVKELNVAIPEQFRTLNCCVGWCHKAVKVRAVHSIFDGFVFSGTKDDTLMPLYQKIILSRSRPTDCDLTIQHYLRFKVSDMIENLIDI